MTVSYTHLIGAVGLQDDAFQRQGGNGLGGTLGPLEGAGPAKADVEPLLCQPERVIGAAGIDVYKRQALGFLPAAV